MNKNIFILLLIPYYIISTGFFSLNISGNIKIDGSGTLRLFYSGTVEEVEQNKYSFGHFPFGRENITKNFSNKLVEISNLKIAKPGDTAYTVVMDLNFKNLLDLNDLKGFTDIKLEMSEEDENSDLIWKVKGNDRTEFLNLLEVNLTFENKIVSSNGMIKDNNITWKVTDFSKNNDLNIKLTPEIKISRKTTEENTSKENLESNSENNEQDYTYDEKPCGIWGLELPIIFLTGLIYSLGKRKFRS